MTNESTESKGTRNSSHISFQAMRRLVIARRLFDHALEHSYKPGALNKMVSVHGFHNAIEIVLKAVILSEKIDPKYQFMDLVKQVLELAKKRDIKTNIPKAHLRQLNSMRNLVQHTAVEPDEGTIVDWRILSRDVIENIIASFFDLGFGEVTEIDLIAFEELRSLLKLADERRKVLESIPKKRLRYEDDEAFTEYQSTLGLLEITFAIAYKSLEGYLETGGVHDLFESPWWPREDPERDSPLGWLWSRLRELEIVNLCQILHVDYSTLRELVEHVPDIVIDLKDQPYLFVMNDANPCPDQLRRLISFEVEVISVWEDEGWLHQYPLGSDPYGIAAQAFLSNLEVPFVDKEFSLESIKEKASLHNNILQGFPITEML